MKTIIKLDTKEMSLFLKNLLCLNNEGRWFHDTVISHLEIQFLGDREKVREEIFEFLSIRRKPAETEVWPNYYHRV